MSESGEARRQLLKRSAVGDFIWVNLCRGESPAAVKRALAEMVDDVAAEFGYSASRSDASAGSGVER